MTDENVTIQMGPLKLAASVITIIASILAGNYWIVVNVVENRILEHTNVPHPVTLQKAEDIARQVNTIGTETTTRLWQEVRGVQMKQASFSSDIIWIKNNQIKTDEKLDEILRRLNGQQ